MKHAVVVFALLIASCAPTRQETIAPVVDTIKQRLDVDTTNMLAREQGEAEANALASQPLSLESAEKLALLENPDLRAAYERLGVSAAAVLQAGLVANPTATGLIRFDTAGKEKPDFEVGVDEDITSLIFALAKHGAAESDRDASVYETAALAVDVAAHAKAAYVRAFTAAKIETLTEESAKIEETALVLATRMHDAGNLSDLDFLRAQATQHEARLAAIDAAKNAADAHVALSIAVGHVVPAPELKDVPANPLSNVNLDALPSASTTNASLQLSALDAHRKSIGRTLGYQDVSRFMPHVAAGAAVEQREGRLEVGPQLTVALPVVDVAQGEIAARESMMRALEAEEAGVINRLKERVEVLRREVPLAAERAKEADALAEVRAKLVDETRRSYNAMASSLRDLLDAQRASADASIEAARAEEAAWLLRIDVDQLVAGGGP